MSTELHLGEAIVLFFAALTLLATIAIALIAAHLSSDFTELRREIETLKHKINQSTQAEERFNFQSEMLLNVSSELYQIISLLFAFFRRSNEINIDKISIDESAIFSTLLSELRDRNHGLIEQIDFFRVLVDLSEESIQGLIDKRPNKHTIYFLQKLQRVAPDSLNVRIRELCQNLSDRILGINPRKWTGR
jgi:hypothetical protein